MHRFPSIRVILLLAMPALLVASGCHSASSEEALVDEKRFGAPLTGKEALSVDAAIERAGSLEERTIAVEGIIREVCTNAGCWFVFESSWDQILRVHVPRDENGDYAFTLPRDVSGKMAMVEGRLFAKELSESERRHYSEEGSGTAVSASEYRIDAYGVVVRDAAT